MRESDLLRHIYAANAGLPSHVTLPPGDDMGAVRIGDRDLLVAVDQVADGVHVDVADMPIDKVGRKAITRNLSDVAAMGAAPVAALAAASLPRGFDEETAAALFDAMRHTARTYRCPLVGGDIAIWGHPLLLVVTVLAEMADAAPLCRRGAVAGDAICVTGRLGGSGRSMDGRVHHLDFEPRLAAGQSLAAGGRRRPHCMIDLSDGLATDLAHLCRAAGLAAVVEAASLPLSEAALAAAAADGRPAWAHAMGDGEDYELCFTLEQRAARHWVREGAAGVAVCAIGRMVPADQAEHTVCVRLPDGATCPVADQGWEHRG